MISLTTFREVFDEFSALADGKILYYLDAATSWVLRATENLESEVWIESTRDELTYLLAAHNLLIQYHEQLSLGGAIASLDKGEKVSFQEPLSSFYKLTKYGRSYYQKMMALKGASIRVI